VLETLAAMVSGSRLKPGEFAARYVDSLGGKPQAMVIGTGIVTSAVHAALANAMAAHADETDDTNPVGPFHAGCGAVSAALAVAELAGRTGNDMLRAVVLGYDIGARLIISLGGAKMGLLRSSGCVAQLGRRGGIFCEAVEALSSFAPLSALSRLCLNILPKRSINLRLIALFGRRLRFEPSDHISVDPQGQLLLDGPVEKAALGIRPVEYLRSVRRVDGVIGQGCKGGQFRQLLRLQPLRSPLPHIPYLSRAVALRALMIRPTSPSSSKKCESRATAPVPQVRSSAGGRRPGGGAWMHEMDHRTRARPSRTTGHACCGSPRLCPGYKSKFTATSLKLQICSYRGRVKDQGRHRRCDDRGRQFHFTRRSRA
jgi:hypothetical protein